MLLNSVQQRNLEVKDFLYELTYLVREQVVGSWLQVYQCILDVLEAHSEHFQL